MGTAWVCFWLLFLHPRDARLQEQPRGRAPLLGKLLELGEPGQSHPERGEGISAQPRAPAACWGAKGSERREAAEGFPTFLTWEISSWFRRRRGCLTKCIGSGVFLDVLYFFFIFFLHDKHAGVRIEGVHNGKGLEKSLGPARTAPGTAGTGPSRLRGGGRSPPSARLLSRRGGKSC